jgi:hypothetical protein
MQYILDDYSCMSQKDLDLDTGALNQYNHQCLEKIEVIKPMEAMLLPLS